MPHWLATIGLGPLLLTQGLWAKRRTPRLPEPAGPRTGVRGSGHPLRILVLGDSAAAGVGASHQDEALSGRIVGRLSGAYATHWTLVARTGATTVSTMRWLEALQPSRFDYVVTSLGVNDILAGSSLSDWLEQQRRMRQWLRDSLGCPRMIVSGLPPVHGFPALPQPLRWYLGRRATEFSLALARDLELEPDTAFLPLDFVMDVRLMAPDGFHPGPETYRQWGESAAALILGQLGEGVFGEGAVAAYDPPERNPESG